MPNLPRYSLRQQFQRAEVIRMVAENLRSIHEMGGGHWPAHKVIKEINKVMETNWLRPRVARMRSGLADAFESLTLPQLGQLWDVTADLKKRIAEYRERQHAPADGGAVFSESGRTLIMTIPDGVVKLLELQPAFREGLAAALYEKIGTFAAEQSGPKSPAPDDPPDWHLS